MHRAIVHLDADAFFSSVEQAADPRLRGKAIAVGGAACRRADGGEIRRGVAERVAVEGRWRIVGDAKPPSGVVPEAVALTAHDGRVLYQNDAFSYREQYQSTQDLSASIREDPAAVNRLARDFAQAVVAAILESY